MKSLMLLVAIAFTSIALPIWATESAAPQNISRMRSNLASDTSKGKKDIMNKSLDREIDLDPKQKVVRVLHAGRFKVTGLGFVKGQILDKHKTQTPAFLFVHTGTVEFSIEGKTTRMSAGGYFEIPADVEHEVKAIEDSRLLLIKD